MIPKLVPARNGCGTMRWAQCATEACAQVLVPPTPMSWTSLAGPQGPKRDSNRFSRPRQGTDICDFGGAVSTVFFFCIFSCGILLFFRLSV